MSESKQRRELLDTMDLIVASIEELNTSIFEFQEQRLSGENGNDLFHFPKLSSKPLSARIEYLRSRLSAPNAPSDPNGILSKKNNILSNKWDALKHEMESLREELKEDKWLGVFKQVTGNAGQMMDSLERAVRQSITFKNYQRLYKTFDAKRKYYVPTVTKMLTMLANGINQQMTRDRDAIKKYKSMKDRWDAILDGVAEVQHDMPGLEAYLDHSAVSNNSPPSSIPSSIASSPPMSPNIKPRGIFSPESGSPPTRGQRSLSPHRIDYLDSPLNNIRSPLRSKSPSPRATSPLSNSRNYFSSANGRSVSSPVRSSLTPLTITRAMSPERVNPSNIPRPVTSMGITNRTPSRIGMRSFLPQPSTPQPGMVSTSRLGMISPPPLRRHHQQIRTPTPSSVTSSLSRPITPENDDRPMTPLTERLSSMSVVNDRNSHYIPLKNDKLDNEVAKIVNSLPLNVKVERAPGGGGKYYFGREKKVFSCKLVNYASSNRNKVIVRVGGGSQDLDMFLLEHSLTSVR
ncbi:3893_t:CDS:2, partial [Cetraspora pellucida]